MWPSLFDVSYEVPWWVIAALFALGLPILHFRSKGKATSSSEEQDMKDRFAAGWNLTFTLIPLAGLATGPVYFVGSLVFVTLIYKQRKTITGAFKNVFGAFWRWSQPAVEASKDVEYVARGAFFIAVAAVAWGIQNLLTAAWGLITPVLNHRATIRVAETATLLVTGVGATAVLVIMALFLPHKILWGNDVRIVAERQIV